MFVFLLFDDRMNRVYDSYSDELNNFDRISLKNGSISSLFDLFSDLFSFLDTFVTSSIKLFTVSNALKNKMNGFIP